MVKSEWVEWLKCNFLELIILILVLVLVISTFSREQATKTQKNVANVPAMEEQPQEKMQEELPAEEQIEKQTQILPESQANVKEETIK